MENNDTMRIDALTVTLEEKGYRVTGCDTSVESVVIPEEVKIIAKGAFKNCYKLKDIVIPDTVERIECGSFEGCNSLVSITLPFIGESRSATSYKAHLGYIFGMIEKPAPKTYTESQNVKFHYPKVGDKVYEYHIPRGLVGVTLSESCKTLPNYGFYFCGDIEHIDLPEEMSKIGDQAFSHCGSLCEIVIPEGITELGGYSFVGCKSLKRAELPESLTKLGEYAFFSLDSLEELIINSASLNIGERAAHNCPKLSHLIVKGELKHGKRKKTEAAEHIASVFENTKIKYIEISADAIPYICATKPETLVITGGVIDASVFSGETSLMSLTVKSGVTEIGDDAFMNCVSLESVTLENGLERIGKSAFAGCNKLRDIVLPDSVKRIGKSAFRGCKALFSFTVGEGVTEIEDDAFEGCAGLIEIINFSPLAITPGSFDHGRIAENAVSVSGRGDSFDSKEVYVGESQVTEIDGFVFVMANDGYYLTGYKGNKTHLILPADCCGEPYSINKKAFYNNENITALTVNGGVKEIGQSAFSDCKNLRIVELLSPIKTVGEEAFFNCPSLEHVLICEGVEVMEPHVFAWCTYKLTICAEAKKRPKGWDKVWAYKNSCKIVWKYRLKKDKTPPWLTVRG